MSKEKLNNLEKEDSEEFLSTNIKSFERDKSLNIHQRIHKVMEEVWYVQKQKKDDGYYPTLEHDDVKHKLRPSIVKHGIVTIPYQIDDKYNLIEKEKMGRDGAYKVFEHFVDLKLYIKFVNIDSPDDFVIGVAQGHGIDQAGNATGKALSYAFKYVCVNTFFLESGLEEDRHHLHETEPDENAAFLYNTLGLELFGEEKWNKIGKKKIYQITRGKTSDASRTPAPELNSAIRNLYELKKKKDENPDKDIEEISNEQEKETMNDILKDFE